MMLDIQDEVRQGVARTLDFEKHLLKVKHPELS